MKSIFINLFVIAALIVGAVKEPDTVSLVLILLIAVLGVVVSFAASMRKNKLVKLF